MHSNIAVNNDERTQDGVKMLFLEWPKSMSSSPALLTAAYLIFFRFQNILRRMELKSAKQNIYVT